MANAGYLSTPRGQINKYVYTRDQCADENPDYTHNSEDSALDGTNDLSGVIQATLNAFYAAVGWVVSNQVLTYNPITDVWDIVPGEYIL